MSSQAEVGESYQCLIGPADDEMLLITSTETWLPQDGEQLAEHVLIACRDGYVALEEWE